MIILPLIGKTYVTFLAPISVYINIKKRHIQLLTFFFCLRVAFLLPICWSSQPVKSTQPPSLETKPQTSLSSILLCSRDMSVSHQCWGYGVLHAQYCYTITATKYSDSRHYFGFDVRSFNLKLHYRWEQGLVPSHLVRFDTSSSALHCAFISYRCHFMIWAQVSKSKLVNHWLGHWQSLFWSTQDRESLKEKKG